MPFVCLDILTLHVFADLNKKMRAHQWISFNAKLSGIVSVKWGLVAHMNNIVKFNHKLLGGN